MSRVAYTADHGVATEASWKMQEHVIGETYATGTMAAILLLCALMYRVPEENIEEALDEVCSTLRTAVKEYRKFGTGAFS